MENDSAKANAPDQGSACLNRAGEPTAKPQKIFDCGIENITKVCEELRAAGVGLQSADGRTQLATLRRALEFRGSRGLSTYEGTAAGYLRMATRVKELKASWDIYTVTEDVIGPDGLVHRGVARYILRGRRQDVAPMRPDERGAHELL